MVVPGIQSKEDRVSVGEQTIFPFDREGIGAEEGQM
jgi:hypothetical protein